MTQYSNAVVICWQTEAFESRERCDVVSALVASGCDYNYIESPQDEVNYISVCCLNPSNSFFPILCVQSKTTTSWFLARDSMLSALYAIARPSVRPSVRPSHGWISQKRLNVSSKFFHRLIGPTF